MRQETLAEEGFERHRKKTRREQFLEEMEQIIPWPELAAVIEPFYPKPEGGGRRPIGIERMLRSTSCNTGSTCPTRRPRKACTTRAPSAASSAPRAKDITQHKAHRNSPLSEKDRARNRNKSRIRAKGEHPLLVLKEIFGFTKVRYRGLHKNANRLFVACGLVNLYMVRRRLMPVT